MNLFKNEIKLGDYYKKKLLYKEHNVILIVTFMCIYVFLHVEVVDLEITSINSHNESIIITRNVFVS